MRRVELIPGYVVAHYGKGEPCKKGETADRTQCVPVSGESGKSKMQEEILRKFEIAEGPMDAGIAMAGITSKQDLLDIAANLPGLELNPQRSLKVLKEMVADWVGDVIVPARRAGAEIPIKAPVEDPAEMPADEPDPVDPGDEEFRKDPMSRAATEELRQKMIFKKFEEGQQPLKAEGRTPKSEEILGNLNEDFWVPMDEIFENMPGINFEEMKDEILSLAEERKISLAAFTKTAFEIPRPELAIAGTDRKLLWHVRLRA